MVHWEDGPEVAGNNPAVMMRQRFVAGECAPRDSTLMDANRMQLVFATQYASRDTVEAVLRHPDAGRVLFEPNVVSGTTGLAVLLRCHVDDKLPLVRLALGVAGARVSFMRERDVAAAPTAEILQELLDAKRDWGVGELTRVLTELARAGQAQEADERILLLLERGALVSLPALASPQLLGSSLLLQHLDRRTALAPEACDALLCALLQRGTGSEARRALRDYVEAGFTVGPKLLARLLQRAGPWPTDGEEELFDFLLARLRPGSDLAPLTLCGPSHVEFLKARGVELPSASASASALARRRDWGALPRVRPAPTASEASAVLVGIARTLVYVFNEGEVRAALEFLRDCGGQAPQRAPRSPKVRALLEQTFATAMAPLSAYNFEALVGLDPAAVSPELATQTLRSLAALPGAAVVGREIEFRAALVWMRRAGGTLEVAATDPRVQDCIADALRSSDPVAGGSDLEEARVLLCRAARNGDLPTVEAVLAKHPPPRPPGVIAPRLEPGAEPSVVTDATFVELARGAWGEAWDVSGTRESVAEALVSHSLPPPTEQMIKALCQGSAAGRLVLRRYRRHWSVSRELLETAAVVPGNNHQVVDLLCESWPDAALGDADCSAAVVAAARHGYRLMARTGIRLVSDTGLSAEAFVAVTHCAAFAELVGWAATKLATPLPPDLMERVGPAVGPNCVRDLLARAPGDLLPPSPGALAVLATESTAVDPLLAGAASLEGALEVAVREAGTRGSGVAVLRLIRLGAPPLDAAAVQRLLACPEPHRHALRLAAMNDAVQLGQSASDGVALFGASDVALAAFAGTAAEAQLRDYQAACLAQWLGRPLPRRPMREVTELLN